MPISAQDPNFNPMGHDFNLDPSIPPHGQHACSRCRIQAASFTHYPTPCPDHETPDPMADLTSAESMGVLVTQAIAQVEAERDQARVKAAHFQALLTRATVELGRVLSILEGQGTTFAQDTAALVEAQEFLDGLPSDEIPEEGPTP